MSVQSFVPQVWEAKLLKNLNDAHVYKKCANQDYEGDISGFGASVKINTIGRIAIGNYVRDTDIADPEALDLEGQMLVIDQAKFYNFAVDDIDKRQARGDLMSPAMTEAAWGLADECDTFMGTTLQNGAGLTQTAATVGMGAGESFAYDNLVEMGVKLDETNTPEDGRWVVVPPWYEGMLRLDDRFSGFGTDKNRATVRGEPIGMVNSMTVYKSNNTPTSGNANIIIAGYKGAFTFGDQLEKTEAYRPQKRFSDAVKGLYVYGAKVTRPSNIISFAATKGSFLS